MRALLSCAFILIVHYVCAQNLRFSHLDQKQGLSQNSVMAFLQDREGFIWVGTQDGLNRYDGYSFTVFRKVPGDSLSLCDNFILSLAEDTEGNIWIGTRNGLCVYVKPLNQFYRFYADAEERKQFHATVNSISALKSGGVVCKNYNNELRTLTLSLNGNSIEFAPKKLADGIRSFAYDIKSERIAYSTDNEIRFCFPNGDTSPLVVNFRSTSRSAPVLLFNQDILYVSDSLQLFSYNLKSNKDPASLATGLSAISSLCMDQENNLWIGTVNSGIQLFPTWQIDGGYTICESEHSDDYFSLKGNRVETIYCSQEGIMWVGTVGGINIYDPLQARFSILISRPPININKPIWFVMSYGNHTLWAGDDGLSYTTDGNNIPSVIASIPLDVPYTCGAFDSRGRLWLGTKHRGIIIVDTITNKTDRTLFDNDLFSGSTIMEFSNLNGKMWVAAIGVLCMVDETTLDVTVITSKVHPSTQIRGTYFTSLCQDESGNMYAGSASGVYRFDKADTNCTAFQNNPENENSLVYNIVNDLLFLDNTLWIATMGSGLDRFDPKTNGFTHYSTQEGLANNTIYGIEAAADGKLWLSTNEGLIVFSPKTGSSRNFTMRDGLLTNEFVINKHCSKSASGHILFGSANGLVQFNPADFEIKPSENHPVLTHLLVNYEERSHYNDSIVQLTSQERNLTFEFTIVDFRNQDKVSYQYMLSGFDTAWHDVSGSSRTAVFTNLPFGDYEFKVRYRISGEAWSDHVLSFRFSIATPFYATWWFILLVSFIGIVTVGLAVRYISQRKLRKQLEVLRVQEQIRNEKERISRDLHDNVGAQLTYVISSLDNLSYSLQKKQVDAESEKLEQLGEFARGTMDQLRESIWAINAEYISLSELGGRWKQFLSRLTESRPEFTGAVLVHGMDNLLKPTVAIEIHRIVQEAITNAFKHSGGDHVEVSIFSKGALTIRIKDNGKGFDGKEKEGHYGIKNMRERAKLIGATLEFKSYDFGTEIILYYNDGHRLP